MSVAAPMAPVAEAGRTSLLADFLASIVVFLVAVPLCMGIAIASGVPPAAGLITGIVGGIVVGMIAGSPLLVSGPAAGLAVLVFELVQAHGIVALGPVSPASACGSGWCRQRWSTACWPASAC
jgi:MFS superfamily sulfate permease-like transporter